MERNPLMPGDKFGKLTVIELDHKEKRKDRTEFFYKCQCECGNFKIAPKRHLKDGSIQSCGCNRKGINIGNRINIAGQKFGRLLVLEYIPNSHSKWLCQCDCGNKVTVTSVNLKNGHTQSCGCLNLDNHTKHGGRHTRLYKIWIGMKTRCYNKKAKQYENYGGRGITICEEWKNDFIKFRDWAIKNGYENNLTLDRIDVNGNYEPHNCRWATTKQQQNNKRNNFFIEYNNERKTIAEWSALRGIRQDTLRNRIVKHHWSIPRALGFER